jgi:hypothetical protein
LFSPPVFELVAKTVPADRSAGTKETQGLGDNLEFAGNPSTIVRFSGLRIDKLP